MMSALRQLKENYAVWASKDQLKTKISTNESYLYQIKLEDLVNGEALAGADSKGKYKTENKYIKKEGLIYTRDKNSKQGLDQLRVDIQRGLLINHQEFKGTEEDLKTAFPSHHEEIALHHSQGPMVFYSGTFARPNLPNMGDGIMDAKFNLTQPDQEDRKDDLYVDENDGKVYFKSIVCRVPLKNQSEEIIGYIKGPFEVLFKLEKNGFAFQHLSTDSQLIRDIFLGKNLSDQRILNESNKFEGESKKIEAIEKILQCEETGLRNSLPSNSSAANPSKFNSKDMDIRRIKSAKSVLEEFRAGKKSLYETHKIITNLINREPKSQISRKFFFFTSTQPSATTMALKTALRNFESATGYTPQKPVIMKFPSLRRF